MKLKTMTHLLEIGYTIYKKQLAFKNWFGTEQNIFAEELRIILEVILMDMGIIRVRGQGTCIVNSDHYEFLSEKFRCYYENEISLEKLVDYIQALRIEEVYYIVNGGALTKGQSIDIVNRLFDLKYLIQSKRNQLDVLTGTMTHSLGMEKKILNIALEELGDQRYFRQIP